MTLGLSRKSRSSPFTLNTMALALWTSSPRRPLVKMEWSRKVA
jgi:hypothetical protein